MNRNGIVLDLSTCCVNHIFVEVLENIKNSSKIVR